MFPRVRVRIGDSIRISLDIGIAFGSLDDKLISCRVFGKEWCLVATGVGTALLSVMLPNHEARTIEVIISE